MIRALMGLGAFMLCGGGVCVFACIGINVTRGYPEGDWSDWGVKVFALAAAVGALLLVACLSLFMAGVAS